MPRPVRAVLIIPIFAVIACEHGQTRSAPNSVATDQRPGASTAKGTTAEPGTTPRVMPVGSIKDGTLRYVSPNAVLIKPVDAGSPPPAHEK
jgi:hypothetical protein